MVAKPYVPKGCRIEVRGGRWYLTLGRQLRKREVLHWSTTPKRCRHCHQWAWSTTPRGKPCHATCGPLAWVDMVGPDEERRAVEDVARIIGTEWTEVIE